MKAYWVCIYEKIHNLEKLTLREIKALLQGLNTIQISGIDAIFIGNLQVKINDQILKIEEESQESSIGEKK